MAKIIAFYSYKGGVGRSVSLANVAALLARHGSRVVCLDCDLEAGGLHTIFDVGASSIRFTIFDQFLGTGPRRVEAALTRLTHLLPTNDGNGELWLLPAISEIRQVNRLLLDQRDLPTLLSSTIRQIEEELNPHYILIDSRSGFAELAHMAITTADRLVCVLRPNKQNIDGLRILLDVLNARRSSPEAFLVLSQVPEPSTGSLTRSMIIERISELQKLLGSAREFGAQIPFTPELALEESVATIKQPETNLARSYEPIATWLMRMN